MRPLVCALIIALIMPAACKRKTETRQAAPAIAVQPAVADSWDTRASHYRGRNGERFTLACSNAPKIGAVWGTDLYTDDSSICTAAMHAGLIDREGGSVTIEIRPGRDAYVGSERRELKSADYGAWPGSFVFLDRNGRPIEPATVAGVLISWNHTAADHSTAVGQRFTYTCAPNGSFSNVWGTDVYTNDSSICTAAVHTGLITSAGGTVTIEMRPGAQSYPGSERYGVTSNAYGAWSSSFGIIGR